MVWKSDTRRNYTRNRSGYASSTTDKEWERVLPQLPKEKTRGRPRKHDLRQIVDEIFLGSSQKSVKPLRPARSDELYCWSQHKAHGNRGPLDKWYAWAIRCRLVPIREKARMLKNHLPHILTCFKHRISNVTAEGLNSKIQTVKANARGYRSFDGFRNSILFYCGGLDMTP